MGKPNETELNSSECCSALNSKLLEVILDMEFLDEETLKSLENNLIHTINIRYGDSIEEILRKDEKFAHLFEGFPPTSTKKFTKFSPSKNKKYTIVPSYPRHVTTKMDKESAKKLESKGKNKVKCTANVTKTNINKPKIKCVSRCRKFHLGVDKRKVIVEYTNERIFVSRTNNVLYNSSETTENHKLNLHSMSKKGQQQSVKNKENVATYYNMRFKLNQKMESNRARNLAMNTENSVPMNNEIHVRNNITDCDIAHPVLKESDQSEITNDKGNPLKNSFEKELSNQPEEFSKNNLESTEKVSVSSIKMVKIESPMDDECLDPVTSQSLQNKLIFGEDVSESSLSNFEESKIKKIDVQDELESTLIDPDEIEKNRCSIVIPDGNSSKETKSDILMSVCEQTEEENCKKNELEDLNTKKNTSEEVKSCIKLEQGEDESISTQDIDQKETANMEINKDNDVAGFSTTLSIDEIIIQSNEVIIDEHMVLNSSTGEKEREAINSVVKRPAYNSEEMEVEPNNIKEEINDKIEVLKKKSLEKPIGNEIEYVTISSEIDKNEPVKVEENSTSTHAEKIELKKETFDDLKDVKFQTTNINKESSMSESNDPSEAQDKAYSLLVQVVYKKENATPLTGHPNEDSKPTVKKGMNDDMKIASAFTVGKKGRKMERQDTMPKDCGEGDELGVKTYNLRSSLSKVISKKPRKRKYFGTTEIVTRSRLSL